MATNIEQPKVSGQAALWAEAMTQNDGIAAAKLMQDNAREIASDFLAAPREWKKWRDVVIRGLVPTAGPTDKLFEVNRLLMQVDREMPSLGSAGIPPLRRCETRLPSSAGSRRRRSERPTRRRTASSTLWGPRLPKR